MSDGLEICTVAGANLQRRNQTNSDLSLPNLIGWSWHLQTSELPVWVAKASSGQFPLPFLISNLKNCCKCISRGFNMPNNFCSSKNRSR